MTSLTPNEILQTIQGYYGGTEYAVSHRRKGVGLVQSACMAARDRLRPILITVLAMLLGMSPLMVATGVGANGSRSLASCVVGGMVLGILALLFLVPALFIIFQWLQERLMSGRQMVQEKNHER